MEKINVVISIIAIVISSCVDIYIFKKQKKQDVDKYQSEKINEAKAFFLELYEFLPFETEKYTELSRESFGKYYR